MRLIDRLLGLVTRRPLPVVVAFALLAGLSVMVARGLRLGESIYDLFPSRPGPIADLSAYTRALGGQQELVALLESADPAALEGATRRLSSELAASPLVRSVRAGIDAAEATEGLGSSLLLLADERSWPEVQRRLTSPSASIERLRRLLVAPVGPPRQLVASDPLLLSEVVLGGRRGAAVGVERGLYASRDGRAALVFAYPRGPSSDRDLCRDLHGLTGRLAATAGPGVRVRFTGAHLYAYYISQGLRRDLAVSSLLALAGVVLIQLLFFRSVRLVPLAAVTAGVAFAATLAVAALSVGHLSALSLAFAALFIGMSDDALIHITAASRRFALEAAGPRMQKAVRAVAPAMLTATATVIAAFLCFALSSFSGLTHLGLLAACGLGINLLLAVTLFPAMGTLLPPGPGPAGTTLIDRWLEKLSELAERRPGRVVLACALLLVGGLLGARGLRFSDDLTRLAPADLPPAETDRAIAQAFERHRDRLVVIARGVDRESVLQANDVVAERLERWRAEGRIAEYQSASRLLPSRATQQARRDRLLQLGGERLAVELAAALEDAGLESSAFEPFLRALRRPPPLELELEQIPASLRPLVERLLVRQGSELLAISVAYPRAGAEVAPLAAELEGLRRRGVHLGVTGAGLAGAQMAGLLRRDLLVISATTAAAVLLLLGLLVRRLWPVLATLLSLLLAGLLFVACLRLLGLEMDLYSLMVLPIIIGYGVDDHLYLVHRSLGAGPREGLLHSGRPVLAATLSTMAALGALAFCRLPGLRALGLTGVLGLALGLLASLVVMPALLSLAQPRPTPRR